MEELEHDQITFDCDRCYDIDEHPERTRSELPITADHHCRSVPRRRPDRRHCPRHRRADARHTGPNRHHRECHRGSRQHWSRPGRSRRTGRLHDRIGHWGTHVVNGATYRCNTTCSRTWRRLPCSPHAVADRVPKSAVPAKDLKELITWLKANPGKAAQGSGGAGSAAHIHGVFFQQRTGTQFQHVPYRGAAPAMQDLIAGQSRCDDRPGAQRPSSCPCRQDQGLCGHGQVTPCCGARYSDGR